MKRSKNFVHLFVLTLVTVVAAMGQSDRGAITGTIQDPASAVVPGATVVAKNTENGSVFETVTTPTGNFTLASLPAGSYDLSVEASGFKKVTQPAIRVQVAQTMRLDFVLQVGATTESITVSAEAPLLKTENGEQSVNVSGDRINSLPINFGGGGGAGGNIRSWTAFALLSPGVTGNNQNTRVNGSPGGNFKIIVEGQDVTSANDTTWTSTVSQASVEMIEEFSLQTANYSPEFGQVAGGLFNFTTRSGTNSLHGSAYEYFANEALDAARPFTAIRPQSRKHDFGFSVGGPVWIPKVYNGRNKTFFFFNYEFFRNRNRASSSFQTVPTDDYRNGNFSAAQTAANFRVLATDGLGRQVIENTIYDPQTNRTVNGRVYRDPFAGNLIPSARFDPVAVKIQNLMPKAINGNLIQNWIPNNDTTRKQGLPGIKLDHNLDSNKRVSFYYSKQTTDQFTANDGLPAPITAVRVQAIYGHTTRMNYDHTITPTLLLHLGSGYLRFHNPDSSPASVLEYDAVAGLGFNGSATSPSGFPRVTGLQNANNSPFGGVGINNGAIGPSNANKYYDSKWTSVASLTYIRGSHTLKLGGEFRLDSWTDRNTRGAQGIVNFSTNQTGMPDALSGVNLGGGSVGMGYASFLLGLTNTASLNAVQDPQWRKKGWALYAQDAWKVTRKLSLDYGLRWDLLTQGQEIFNRNSIFGIVPNPSIGGRLGGLIYEGNGPGRCNCTFTDLYPYAIGPRFGAAYQFDTKTVVRGGAGVIYGNLSGYAYLTNQAILGVGFDQKNWDSPAAGEPATVLRSGLPFSPAELYTATLNPGLRPTAGQLNQPGLIIDRSGGRPPRILQFNISLQREIGRNMSVEAAYVANRGTWLTAQNMVAPNALSDSILSANGLSRNNPADIQLLNSRIDSALAIQRGFNRLPYAGFPVATTAGVAQSLRPFPQFANNLAARWAPLGNSWYDSLQMKFTKRYSHGLDFSAAFTWAKELSTNGTNDVFNRPNQKALSSNGVPLSFVTGFNYEVPKFSQNRLVRAVFAEWTIGGILRYQSGQLIQSPGSNNQLNSLIYQATRMNRVPGEPLFLKDLNCHCIDPNKDLVYNPKAWVDVPAGQWGASAEYYNDYRRSRHPDEQFSLGRRFTIKEGIFLQIRGEFFNAFNRIHLADPTGAPNNVPTYDAQGRLSGGFGRIDPTATNGAFRATVKS